MFLNTPTAAPLSEVFRIPHGQLPMPKLRAVSPLWEQFGLGWRRPGARRLFSPTDDARLASADALQTNPSGGNTRAPTGVASNSALTLKLSLAFYYIFRAGKTAGHCCFQAFKMFCFTRRIYILVVY